MGEWVTLVDIDEARDYILEQIAVRPTIGLILGSGLGDLAEAVENPVSSLTSKFRIGLYQPSWGMPAGW